MSLSRFQVSNQASRLGTHPCSTLSFLSTIMNVKAEFNLRYESALPLMMKVLVSHDLGTPKKTSWVLFHSVSLLTKRKVTKMVLSSYFVDALSSEYLGLRLQATYKFNSIVSVKFEMKHLNISSAAIQEILNSLFDPLVNQEPLILENATTSDTHTSCPTKLLPLLFR